MIQLRDNQSLLKDGVNYWWDQGALYVLMVLPTGGGKTVIFASIVADQITPTVVIAHRKELVGQVSLSLCRENVYHKIIAPKDVIKWVRTEQVIEFGKDFYDPNSKVVVAGVDTLLSRKKELAQWAQTIRLWVIDEAHHVLKENKWGKVVSMFPYAKGLGATATPCRADGKGLGRDFHGVFDVLVEGPSMRELINQGFLTDYKIFVAESDIDISNVNMSKDGDFNKKQLSAAARGSHIVGDVVDQYLKVASGKLGITFMPDVAISSEVANHFRAKGVKSEAVSAKTSNSVRSTIIRDFRGGHLHQLVNVDLFGEGFDLPAIEYVGMGRHTASFPLYAQQGGRAIRPMEGKTHGVISDHVGNVIRHNVFDKPRNWTLEPREGTPKTLHADDEVPVTYCPSCTEQYERTYKICPHCGYRPVPADRSSPEFVDGDLTELTPEILEQLRGEIKVVDEPDWHLRDRMQHGGAPDVVWRSAVKNHRIRQEIQTALREAIAWWAGIQKWKGHDDSYSYRLFFHLFGMDVLTAQSLGKNEALKLADKINRYIGESLL